MRTVSYLTAWAPAALYMELYVGMCRALLAPWLTPWALAPRPGVGPASSAPHRTPTEPAAAEPAAPATAALPEPHGAGALIIPFDRARARLAAAR
jgi:hypothetical protein